MLFCNTKAIINFIKINWQKIWLKFCNFDVLPQAPKVPEFYLQAEAYFYNGDYSNARVFLDKLLEIAPNNINGLYFLANLLMLQNKFKTAIEYFKKIIKLQYKHQDAYIGLGFSYLAINKKSQALAMFNKMLELVPEHSVAKHFKNIAAGILPAKAEKEYIIALFDSYAYNYEHALVKILSYTVPEKLTALLKESMVEADFNLANTKILDLGCGTGLMGIELKKNISTAEIDGIDLSEKMLTIAKSKNIYAKLSAEEISDFFHNNPAKYAVITAADVFVYMGDLSVVFNEVQNILIQGGYFVFSVEAMGDVLDRNYILDNNGRYQHSIKYLVKLAEQNNWRICKVEQFSGRTERLKPVIMHGMVLRKKT